MSSIKEISLRSTAAHPSKVRLSASLFSTLRASVSGVARALRNRVSASGLHDLDDHMLEDIGLTRFDLERAFATTGTFEDPTPGLNRAVRARAWRRAANRDR